MALQVTRVHRNKYRFVAMYVAVMALAIQPVYGALAGFVARASSNETTAVVTDQAGLVAAAANQNITAISIKSSIALNQKLSFSGRSVSVDGNGNTIKFNGDQAGWQGNYVVQAYKNIMSFKNLTLTGGDAGLYVNGATVALQGVMTVSGNEFGGIEVSRGSNVETPAVLDASKANLVNSTEAFKQPTVWTDQASTANATVTGSQLTSAAIAAKNQIHYYLQSVHAAPATPSNLKITQGGKVVTGGYTTATNAVLTWDSVADRERYQVKITDPNGVVVDGRYTGTPIFNLDDSTRFGYFGSNQGVWQYQVRVKDDATKLWSAYSAPASLSFDTSKPIVETITGEKFYNRDGTLTVRASDNIALDRIVGNIYDKDNKVLVKSHTTGVSGATGSLNVSLKDLSDGTYTLRYNASDKAGAISSTKAFTFTIDTAAPTATIKPGSAGNEAANVFRSLSYKLHDASSGIAKVAINGKEKVLANDTWSDLNTITPGVFGAKEGDNTMVVYDRVGNSTTYTFSLDTTSPKATFIYSNNNGNSVTKDDIQVTLKTNESIKTPADWVSVNGSTTEFTRVYRENGKFSDEIEDIAGNVAAAKYEIKRYDNVAPVFLAVVDGSSYKQETINIAISEDNLGIVIDNGNKVAFTSTKPHTISVHGYGTHTIVAVDKAGNTTALTITLVKDDSNQSGNEEIDPTPTNPGGTTTPPASNGETTGSVSNNTATNSSSSQSETTIVAQSVTNRPGVMATIASTGRSVASSPAAIQQASTGAPSEDSTGSDTRGDVLGTTDTKVSATSSDDTTAIANGAGWKLFGFAWYWWLALLAAVIALWWFIAAARRRRDNHEA